jgi:hypothetical protein
LLLAIFLQSSLLPLLEMLTRCLLGSLGVLLLFERQGLLSLLLP